MARWAHRMFPKAEMSLCNGGVHTDLPSPLVLLGFLLKACEWGPRCVCIVANSSFTFCFFFEWRGWLFLLKFCFVF